VLATSTIRRLCLRGALTVAVCLSLHAAPASAQEAKTGSPAFERFRWSFFDNKDSWRDGLDREALLQLAGEERSRAEDMLTRLLPDERGIIGLGELRSSRAEPQLVRLFNAERQAQRAAKRAADSGWLPYRLLHLAKALWQIRPDPRWLAAVTEVLASADLDIQRQDAAATLSVFHDPAAVRALVNALDDPAKLVRHHAARALLMIHGLGDEADFMSHGPEHMMFRVMSNDSARREGGKRDILAAIAGRTISAP